MPDALASVFDGLAEPPLAMGANCGVGASDILVTVLSMAGCEHPGAVISKGNCGIPQFQGSEIVYSGTPDLMASYATLAADAGARIVGGCCGTTPEHLAAMRRALDARVAGAAPTVADIVDAIGPLTNAVPTASTPNEGRNRRSRRISD
jgi:5-methyltetrahydrofolate--homocysteine methyltransferase